MINSLGRLYRQAVFTFFLACLLSFTLTSVAAAEIGDSRSQITQQYGNFSLVQDSFYRIWTASEWQEASQGNAKAYGYRPVNGLQATTWLEYDNQEKVVKETIIMDGNIKIREFANYFGNLYTELIAPDSAAFIISAFPKDQLGVIVRKSANKFNLVRFSLANVGDNTKINMHSRIKSFEIKKITAVDAQNYLKLNKAIQVESDVYGQVTAAVGTWLRTDNYFRPELYFSENLAQRPKTDMIVIHHTALDNMSVADIHELHLTNGWAGIGYHKVILSDGTVEIGRPENTIGAHALGGANLRSIGIVVDGNFENKRPTPAQMDSLVKLTLQLMQQYSIPLANVLPHRAVTLGTSCPGAAFPWDEFIQRLKSSAVKADT
jgi:hypothetical protein